jgi:hypothetical protein
MNEMASTWRGQAIEHTAGFRRRTLPLAPSGRAVWSAGGGHEVALRSVTMIGALP